jgi:hypothetical protein
MSRRPHASIDPRAGPTPKRESQDRRHGGAAIRDAGRQSGQHKARIAGDGLRNTVQRGARRAKVPGWHPNQLRQSMATQARKEYELEHTQVILGHSKADMTQRNTEVDAEKGIGKPGIHADFVNRLIGKLARGSSKHVEEVESLTVVEAMDLHDSLLNSIPKAANHAMDKSKIIRPYAERNAWLYSQYMNCPEKTLKAIRDEAKKTKGWLLNSDAAMKKCVRSHCDSMGIDMPARKQSRNEPD